MSRFTQFRKDINNVIISHKSNNLIFLIDCHSFPANNFQSISVKNPDMSILFLPKYLMIIDDLYNDLRDSNILVTKFIGKGNDIIESSDDYNRKIIPILLEVNEKLLIISKCIDKWINKINEYYSK